MDKLTPQRRSENMRAIRSKDMKPEMHVRRLVHGMGYRYRLHRKDLPGKPDLVFPRRRKVIFVHGCFWHQHPDPTCKITRLPKSNLEYWLAKLDRNKMRDKENQSQLKKSGWQIMTVWECEVKELVNIAKKIRAFLDM